MCQMKTQPCDLLICVSRQDSNCVILDLVTLYFHCMLCNLLSCLASYRELARHEEAIKRDQTKI